MKLVGLVSAYKEGRLIRGALASLARAELDALYVYEGPAGDVLDTDVPASEYARPYDKAGMTFFAGRWRTDARKRDEMLKRAKKEHPGPTWGIVLDGDEILGNGEYLRDILQAYAWDDEYGDASEPWARWPLRLIEPDGTISLTGNRVIRLDLVKSIDVSASVVTNSRGIQEGWGNVEETSRVWLDHFLGAVDAGRMMAWPPLPCEPYIYHRSHLRHPLRRGNRLHRQEAVELVKAQLVEPSDAA